MTAQEIATIIAQLQAELAVQAPIASWLQHLADRWDADRLTLDRARDATDTVQALNNTIATLQRQPGS